MKTLLESEIKVLLVFLFVSLTSAYYFIPCARFSESNGEIYANDLSNLGSGTNNWMNASDNNGNIWYWKVCLSSDGVPYEQNSPCGPNISVCVSNDGKPFESRGNLDLAERTDMNSAIEVIYTGYACPNDNDEKRMKTVIDYVCPIRVDNTPQYIYANVEIKSDGCYTTITVISDEACNHEMITEDESNDEDSYSSDESNGNNHDDSNSDVNSVEPVPSHSKMFADPIILFIGLISGLCVCVLLTCCCCIIKKRKQCQQKSIAMKQFSNIAFQPIPQTHQHYRINNQNSLNQISVPIPSYNPFIIQTLQSQQQQPHVYYHQVDHQVQLSSDEQLAKELQSQFDHE